MTAVPVHVPTEQEQEPSLFEPGQPPAKREVGVHSPSVVASAVVQTGQGTSEVALLQTGLALPGSFVQAASDATVERV